MSSTKPIKPHIQSTKIDTLYPSYDVIVIGAGIAGLICAAFLAKSGKKVLLIEQHFIPGGYCTSFKRKGFLFDAAVHHIGGCGKWSVVGRCFKMLGIDMDFYHLDPMDNLIFPTFSIEIPADLDEYLLRLQKRYPHEKDNIKGFFQDFIKLYRATFHNEKSQVIEKYKDMTYGMMLDHFFDDSELKMVLSGQWGYVGLAPSKASAIAMSQMMINYLKDGAFFPKGGTQEFANAIFRKFIDFGGHVMLSSKVKKILKKGLSVSGVKLNDDKEIHSSVVVSNIDARQTFYHLLSDKNDVDAMYLKKIEGMKESCSFFLLYLGVGEGIDLNTLKRGFYLSGSTFDSIDSEWMYISVPTRICQTLAPQNKQIISLVVYKKEEFYKNVTDWELLKQNLVSNTLERLESYLPDIKKHIEVIEMATPKTLERYTLNTNGAAYGWAVSVDQIWEQRLSPATPISGLYLAGHWTRPGPGICAVVSSGWGVANLILDNWR
ncbi:NAD(P)/FAD-dependent oxidoreductase [Candidatus Kuenenia sp.]|uniref:phytoene desaturase family protein n=1 Tax=Candidatus Kuenenia sp. TaxID=2499824 RepID=UPI00321FC7E1